MTFHYNSVGSYCIIYKTNSVLSEHNFSTYLWNIMEKSTMCNNIINYFVFIIIITIFDIFVNRPNYLKIVLKNIKS